MLPLLLILVIFRSVESSTNSTQGSHDNTTHGSSGNTTQNQTGLRYIFNIFKNWAQKWPRDLPGKVLSQRNETWYPPRKYEIDDLKEALSKLEKPFTSKYEVVEILFQVKGGKLIAIYEIKLEDGMMKYIKVLLVDTSEKFKDRLEPRVLDITDVKPTFD